MRTDYKFWYVRQDDDGVIEEVAVRFYEGDVTTEPERGQPVTRYRRVRRLPVSDLAHLGPRAVAVEASGAEAVIYTARNFGWTTDLADVRAVLNTELQKDQARLAIAAQIVTVEDETRLAAVEARQSRPR